MNVLLFCGLQAAGKSTFYQTHFLTTHLLISKDLLTHNKNKERRQRELLHLALQAQHSVVIDNTNPTPAERIPLIEIAHSYQAQVIGYYFTTTTRLALQRNAQRAGIASVPPIAIYSTASRLVPPAYAEGFDTLYYVQIADDSTPATLQWQIEKVQNG